MGHCLYVYSHRHAVAERRIVLYSSKHYGIVWLYKCLCPFSMKLLGAGMQKNQPTLSGIRLAELIGALSIAIDLGLGQPMEKFLRTCLLGVRLGKLLSSSEEDLTDIYYLGLIQHLGCTAYADDTAAVFGDDIEANTWLFTTDL